MYMAGLDPTETGTLATHLLGEIVFNASSAGVKGYVYVQAGAGGFTGDGYVCDVDGSSYSAVMCTTTTAAPGTGSGKLVGIARVAVAASSFGWLQIFGPGLVRTSASCAAYTIINTTATAGQLNSDATVGARIIDGIVLDVATGGAAAITAGFINWPRVGRTL